MNPGLGTTAQNEHHMGGNARVICRLAQEKVEEALLRQPAVMLVGPRGVGKTTLALRVAEERNGLYLDLEEPADRQKLDDPKLFLEPLEDRLVVLDEIHRAPEVLPSLRGLMDRGRRRGVRAGRFLLLGSASFDLLRQTGESLAGRVAEVELAPLDLLEIPPEPAAARKLWVRGGFPDAFLAADDRESRRIRSDFLRTIVAREVGWFAPRLPTATLARLWTMLAHSQGGLLHSSRLAASLGIATRTTNRYLDLLADLLFLRRLPPFHANLGKRLVKSPRIYLRDSGLCHALLGIEDWNDLAGHPVTGPSWEGFVVENLLAVAPERTAATFFRTAAGAEMDLVLDFPDGRRWAIEAKRGLAPTVSRGFHEARAALRPTRTFIAYSGDDRYPFRDGVEVIGLRELMAELAGAG